MVGRFALICFSFPLNIYTAGVQRWWKHTLVLISTFEQLMVITILIIKRQVKTFVILFNFYIGKLLRKKATATNAIDSWQNNSIDKYIQSEIWKTIKKTHCIQTNEYRYKILRQKVAHKKTTYN